MSSKNQNLTTRDQFDGLLVRVDLLLRRASPGPASLAWSALALARLRFIAGAKAYRASKNVKLNERTTVLTSRGRDIYVALRSQKARLSSASLALPRIT